MRKRLTCLIDKDQHDALRLKLLREGSNLSAWLREKISEELGTIEDRER
jgi:hypothetical protein